jgi:hypothetical protein
MRRLLAHGLVSAVLAAAATTLGAVLLGTAGVDLEVTDGTIPASGVGVVTLALGLVGVVLAATLRRWSSDPATSWVRATLTLTAASVVPPFVAADLPVALALAGLHLVAAAVVVPTVAEALRRGHPAPGGAGAGGAGRDVRPARR